MPRRSRGKAPTSVLKITETAVIANAVTQGMFNVDLRTFVMGGGSSEGVNPTGGRMITARELISGIAGNSAGTSGTMTFAGRKTSWGDSLGGQIKTNLEDNGIKMMLQVVGIPLAFKFGKKILSKPILNPANKLLRTVGIKEVKL